MSVRLEDLPPWAREQAERQLRKDIRPPAAAPADKPAVHNKYYNQPDTRADIKFDSKKEARHFDELMLRLQAGEIRKLKLQKDFTLQEAYTTPEGVRVRAIRYRADFAYERATAPDATGTVHWIKVVEDVKSRATRTDLYKVKKKMMRERLGIDVQEVI